MSLCTFQTRVALAGRSILLVIDNCEHVADAAASGANMLLEGAPELHVLAGSLDPSTCLGLEATSAQRGFGEAWGRGLLLAPDLQRPVGSQIVATLMQNGLLINSPRPDSLRYTPALA